MIVEELERRFFELKGKLDVGAISEEQFKDQVQKLRFQDTQNRWWMIGAQSGKWYMYDGARWIPGMPPADVVSATQAAVESQTRPSETAQTAPDETSTPAIGPLLPQPERLTPGSVGGGFPSQQEQIPRVPVARPSYPQIKTTVPSGRSMPVSGLALIGIAAIVALIGILAFWFVLDNFMPGKPISSFLAGATGSKTSASVTPTPAGPKDTTALIAMGDQLVLQSNFDSAITQYQSAAQLAPTNPVPLTRLSRALAFKGLIQDAVARAQQAVQRAPNDVEANAQLCRSLTWNGQTDDAIKAGEKAIQIDPNNANARAFLTEAYLSANRLVDAQAQAYAAVKLAPQSAEAHRAQAWVLTIQGQKDNALPEWQQTVTLEPNLYIHHYELAEMYRLFFKSPAEAVAEYQKALTLYGAYIPAINRLGLAMLDANQPQNAVAQFKRVITLDPLNAEGYAYLGIAFGKASQCGQAIPYFEQALKLDANNSLAQKGLSDCKAGKAPSIPPPTPPSAPLSPPTIVPSK